MERINVADAERDFSNLVQRVYAEGVAFELALSGTVVARLLPAANPSSLDMQGFRNLLASLPTLGDDADAFDADVRAIRREFPAENSAWD
jgi:antitoxin (DNA-binding transcriptional repressor) of toxin-antitoxin stability system